MKIGTPLGSNATRVLLLGSGELGKELAISLLRFGVEVIAVDRYPNAPAQQVAQHSLVIDMTDAEALYQLVKQVQPDIIVPEIEAIATEALQRIEQEGVCQVVPNARAIQLTMNREGIRELAATELNLPTSKFVFADEYEVFVSAIEKNIGYPCFVKPTMSSSGKGQSVVQARSELQSAWNYAKTSGRANTGKVIAESVIDFDYEITLLTIRAVDNQGQVATYFCDPIGHIQNQGDYRESWQPQPMSAIALGRSQTIAESITSNLGGLGLFGVELFVKADQVWFSEVSPRPHDTGMVTMVTQRQSEFDLHARALLGLPVMPQLACAGASAVILSDTEATEPCYRGLVEALADPATEVRLFGKPDALVGRRMGVALAAAESVQMAREIALNAANKMTIT